MSLIRWAVLLAICAALAIGLWRPGDREGVFGALEGRLLDARFAVRGTQTPPDSLAVLAIDDISLAALGTFPPPRDALAVALRAARKAGAKVVAFDLLLVQPTSGDDALAEALAEPGDTILAISLSESAPPPLDAVREALSRSSFAITHGAPRAGPAGALVPIPAFAAQSTLAHVNISLEGDGALRRVPLAVSDASGVAFPALPLVAAAKVAGIERSAVVFTPGEAVRFGPRTIELTPSNEAGIAYFGPRGTIPTYSLIDAASAPLAGKAVFIGGTASGFGDTVPMPFDRELPGVEALATMTANILADETLRRTATTKLIDLGLALVFAALAALAASRQRPALAVGLTLATWGVALGVLQIGFLKGLWLDGATLTLSLAVATLAGAIARRVVSARRSRNLAQYQSPKLSEALASQARPDFDGRLQKAAVLFVDAANFTERSMRIGPEATSGFLKEFHTCVDRAATACDGVITMYAGDGAMIVFGLPDASEVDAANAMRCADRLFGEVAELSRKIEAQDRAPVTIRIGAHYGEVYVAILGGASHRHATVSGDTVNTASRLQGLAKDVPADLVVSAELLATAGAARTDLSDLGPLAVRGRDAPLHAWARVVNYEE